MLLCVHVSFIALIHFFCCWSFHLVSFHLYACILKSFLADLLNERPTRPAIIYRSVLTLVREEEGAQDFWQSRKNFKGKWFVFYSLFLLLPYSLLFVFPCRIWHFIRFYESNQRCMLDDHSENTITFSFSWRLCSSHTSLLRFFLVHFLRTIWLMNIEIDWMILIVAHYSTWFELKVEKVLNAPRFVYISFVPNISFHSFRFIRYFQWHNNSTFHQSYFFWTLFFFPSSSAAKECDQINWERKNIATFPNEMMPS